MVFPELTRSELNDQMDQESEGNNHQTCQQPSMGRLSPRRAMNRPLVDMSKFLTLMLGIKYPVFDQFVQAILQRVLNDTKNTVLLITLVDTVSLEVPELAAEASLGLHAIVDTTQLDDIAPVRAESRTYHRSTTVQADLLDRSFRKATCPCFSAHGVSNPPLFGNVYRTEILLRVNQLRSRPE
jgi:hypothetical protein